MGAAFSELFKGEEGSITVVFKLYDGKFVMFYKDDEQSYFPIRKRSARYADEWRFCSECQRFYLNKCLTHGIKLRNTPRKKKKGNNGSSITKFTPPCYR